MARSEVSVANNSFNAATDITADAMDTTNHHFIDLAGCSDERFLVRLTGSTTIGTVSFKAGDFPAGGIGDLDVEVDTTDIKTVMLESSRFKDSDGYVLIDLSSTGTFDGTIEAYSLVN